MKRINALLLAALVALAVFGRAAQAQVKIADTDDTKLFVTLNTVGTLQTLHQTNVFDAKGNALAPISGSMQTAFGDLGFKGQFGKHDEVDMYFDLYLASRNHPSQTYGNEGYLVIHGIPESAQGLAFLKPVFNKVDIKAGAFLLDYGDHLNHRSNNAIVQKNPLVGNYVIDPNLVSIGVEVMSKPNSRYGWLVGGSNGTNTEDFSAGRGIAGNAKVWLYPVSSLRTSLSVFGVNHSESATSTATLFSGNRSGERYGAVLGGGQAPGDVLPGNGKDVRAAQFDVTWDDAASPLKLYGNYGLTSDHDVNGPAPGKPQTSWRYYAGEVVYKFNPTYYAAARVSGAAADKLAGISSTGSVSRFQVGGGLWLTRNTLVKVEYVNQRYNGFANGDVLNNNIAAWKDPAFKGFVSEVSFAF